MIDFNKFNLMRYPFFWSTRTKDILKEQLKYTHWIFAKQHFDPETKSRVKIYYANLPCSFDIEDSSFYDQKGDKVSIMYVWQVGINGIVYMGRTWNEFKDLINILDEYADQTSSACSTEYRFLIYVHFLDHEFQFIRKRFKWDSVFSRKERSPIYARTGHIEFRDSYILTGKSLAATAKDIRTFKGLHKMIGDLDYSKIRGNRTHLYHKEIKYCMADVQILNVVIMEKMQDEHDNIAHIPLTNTGYVRRYCRNACYSKKKSNKHNSYVYYTGIHKMTLEPREYQLLYATFQGGFTHANPLYYGEHIKGKIDSIDFTSSYPAVLLSNLFPASKGELVHPKDQDEFERYIKDYLCVFAVRFIKIKQKEEAPDSIISFSKCNHKYTVNARLNNGRVYSADDLITYVTNIDFEMLKKFYDWKEFYVSTMYIYRPGLLPKSLIQCVLEFYKAKTTLKGVHGAEIEYLLKKGMLNSVYGMMVTNIVKPVIICDESGEWREPEVKELDVAIHKYNENKKRFLFYPWGIFVTSYARRNLLQGILEFGKNDYIYSDTDSIKCLNIDRHMEYIKRYNADIISRISHVLNTYGIDPKEAAPLNSKGISKPMGVWDIETSGHPYKEFKTLGAKRYMLRQDDDIFITIAGVSKLIGAKYISGQKDPFDFFDDKMKIPGMYSGKLVHTYIDEERSGNVIDYQGNLNFYDEKSAVHLEPASYSMTVLDTYIDFCKAIKNRNEENHG